MKSSWEFYERAQQAVYRKLKARERSEAVVGGGWGFLDHFFIFLFSLGFFARIDFLPQRVRRVMIPTVLMILTYEVKQLMGISSMNQLEEHPCLRQAGVSGYGPFKDYWIYGPSDSGGVLPQGEGKTAGADASGHPGRFAFEIFFQGGGFHIKGGRAGLGWAQINSGQDLYPRCDRFANDQGLQGLWDEESGREGMEQRGSGGGDSSVCIWLQVIGSDGGEA
jgi:hypothetical protein